MLVQEVQKPQTGQKKASRGASRGTALYGRAALDSAAQQARIGRHLTELEQDNYHAIQIDIPKSEITRKQHKTTPNVRKLLTTKKTLNNLLDEAGLAAEVYKEAGVKPGPYPSRTFCSVCGYWGRYGCSKCGERYCGEICGDTHRGLFLMLSSANDRNEMHEVFLISFLMDLELPTRPLKSSKDIINR